MDVPALLTSQYFRSFQDIIIVNRDNYMTNYCTPGAACSSVLPELKVMNMSDTGCTISGGSAETKEENGL